MGLKRLEVDEIELACMEVSVNAGTMIPMTWVIGYGICLESEQPAQDGKGCVDTRMDLYGKCIHDGEVGVDISLNNRHLLLEVNRAFHKTNLPVHNPFSCSFFLITTVCLPTSFREQEEKNLTARSWRKHRFNKSHCPSTSLQGLILP